MFGVREPFIAFQNVHEANGDTGIDSGWQAVAGTNVDADGILGFMEVSSGCIVHFRRRVPRRRW